MRGVNIVTAKLVPNVITDVAIDRKKASQIASWRESQPVFERGAKASMNGIRVKSIRTDREL